MYLIYNKTVNISNRSRKKLEWHQKKIISDAFKFLFKLLYKFPILAVLNDIENSITDLYCSEVKTSLEYWRGLILPLSALGVQINSMPFSWNIQYAKR